MEIACWWNSFWVLALSFWLTCVLHSHFKKPTIDRRPLSVILREQQMNATQWAAWVGAGTGIVSLAWNIYLRISAGPKLRVMAYAGMIMMPSPPGEPHFLRATTENLGDKPTTVTNYCLFKYESRWNRLRAKTSYQAVLTTYQGPQCPHKLEVGNEVNILMEHDDRFEELLRSGPVWLAVFHSFSKRPTQSKIIWPKPANTY